MNILIWLVFGLLVGLVAWAIMPDGPKPHGILLTMALGIVGAIVGGWIGTVLHISGIGSFILAGIAAVVVLGIYHATRPRWRRTL